MCLSVPKAVMNLWRPVVIAVTVAGLQACSSLSSLPPAPSPSEFASAPAVAPPWAELEALRSDNWNILLNDGVTALDWRLTAIESATQSLDLQTFLWSLDRVGSAMLNHLLAAADRGVRVRLLVDDSFLLGEDDLLVALADHPNISYRVFNPYQRRQDSFVTRELMNLGDFDRRNHRMHNKVMLVDNRVAIVGGRNLADEYFGLHEKANFRDMELLVGGSIVPRLSEVFDDYWNDLWSVPIEELAYIAPDYQRLAETVENAPVQLARELIRVFESAEEEVIVISAYLIPSPGLEAVVERAVRRGVRIASSPTLFAQTITSRRTAPTGITSAN
ncbi:phospholipase D-like domain-containing protein [Congregibacter sp.]|uniref:phospholipase D-like domain-containing protein n=1 Tax=Congregibacter sp. TaxID=2744308 RepID=UPI003F6C33E1